LRKNRQSEKGIGDTIRNRFAALPCIRKTDLVVAGNSLSIPERTARLLFISYQAPEPHGPGIGISISLDLLGDQIHIQSLSPDEPSTIYAALPVRRPVNPTLIPRPDYYPSYAGLSPEQRWTYLNWLSDVTQPINIGYVFIYYYGLDRHLVIGEFELAFDEILLLQRTHSTNASFRSYSRSALLNSALFRKRRNRLEQLYQLSPPDRLENTDLILAHQLGYDLAPEGLIRLAPCLREVNRRYIQKNPEDYRQALVDVLSEEFGEAFLPFASAYTISEIPKEKHVLFANISFPCQIRSPALPSFLSHGPFVREATRILGLAHERTKRALAAVRRRTRTGPA
jgi:hypothetical protein